MNKIINTMTAVASQAEEVDLSTVYVRVHRPRARVFAIAGFG